VGDEEVDKNDQDRRVDHGRNCGAAYAFRAARSPHPVETADRGDDVAEEKRLDESLDDIGIHEVLVGHMEILRAVLVVQDNGDGGAAQDAERVGDDGEEEKHDNRGEDARRYQLAHGIDTQGAHGVNLLRDNHGSEFAGHGRCVAARDHDAGEHRAQFANHGDTYELACDGSGAEFRKCG